MIYRRATAADVPAMVDFAIEGMRPQLSPHLRLSRDRVETMVHHFVTSVDDFNLGAFEGRTPVAAVAAFVQPNLWFERHEAHVVICRSTHPGAGARCIRALMAWAKADIRIRQVSFALEPDADGRQLAMLQRRFGFQRSQQVALWAKE